MVNEDKVINGVINIYKEKGFTSHDVVAKLRGILKTKKIGHTGTLDPDAEGVLPVCIGNATKLCDLIMEKVKTYEAVLLLGRKTDTQDMSGGIIEEREVREIDGKEISEVLSSFLGEVEQVPPMYSAIKINGKKLYELARAGVEVERKARKITVYDIQILSMELPRITIRFTCSKGTYIRTLCNDIGEKLGTFGCMEKLLRTKSGIFELENSVKICEVEKIVSENKLDEILIPTDEVLCELPRLIINGKAQKLLLNGNILSADAAASFGGENVRIIKGKSYRIYDENGKFAAVYSAVANDRLKAEKMFL